MSEKLRPCPFCGGCAVLLDEPQNGNWPWWNVVCKNCYLSHYGANTEAEAIAAWNRRADDQRLQQATDLLERVNSLRVDCPGFHARHFALLVDIVSWLKKEERE